MDNENLIRYEHIGEYEDKSKAFLPNKEGDFIKFKDRYLYRPLNVDKDMSASYRARSLLKQLILSNNPTWFVTLTHNDPALRSSYNDHIKAGSLMLRRLRDIGVRAFFISEYAKSTGWHYHGVYFDPLPNHILSLKTHHKTGKVITKFIKPLNKSLEVYKTDLWESGKNGMGFEFLTSLNNTSYPSLLSISKYVTKYITKNFITSIDNRKRYLRSRGLTFDKDIIVDKAFGIAAR